MNQNHAKAFIKTIQLEMLNLGSSDEDNTVTIDLDSKAKKYWYFCTLNSLCIGQRLREKYSLII